MAERSYNGRNIYTPLIDGATGDIARTSSGYIEADTYKLYANVIASGVSAEFDSSVVRSNRLSLKLSTTNATGRARAGFAASATSGSLVTVSDMAYLPKAKPVSTYNFSIWAKTNNVTTDGCYVTVASTSGNGTTTFVMLTTTKLTGTNDWTELSGQFTTRQDTAALRVIFFNDVAGNVSDAWFDVGSMQITEVLPARTTATSRTTASNRVAVRDMGTALRFDGVNDEVTTPIDSTKFDPTQPFTITFELMDIPFVTTSLGVAGMWLASAGQRNFGISIGSTRRVIFTMRNASDVSVDSTANVSVRRSMRNFVAVRFNGTHMQAYVNGSWNTETAITPAAAGAQAILIGRANVSANPFYKGRIDNFRVFQKALSDAEVDNLNFMNIVPQDGLVAEYLFDEASGTTAIDTSGNGNDGTITGATYATDTPLRPRTVIMY